MLKEFLKEARHTAAELVATGKAVVRTVEKAGETLGHIVTKVIDKSKK